MSFRPNRPPDYKIGFLNFRPQSKNILESYIVALDQICDEKIKTTSRAINNFNTMKYIFNLKNQLLIHMLQRSHRKYFNIKK